MESSNIKDTSNIRKIIATVLSEMEDKFTYIGNENGQAIEKSVSFFYSITSSSQRYLNKYFLRDGTKEGEISNVASLPIPRGVLISDNIEIDNSAKTNPFVRGNYRKLIDGNIEMVSSELRFVPLNIPMKVSITTSNVTQLMSVFESMALIADASIPFYYYVNGIQIGGLIVFPESLNKDISSEWSLNSNNELVHEVNLDVKSSIVSFDDKSERHLRTRMKQLNLNKNVTKAVPKSLSNSKRSHGIDSPFGN